MTSGEHLSHSGGGCRAERLDASGTLARAASPQVDCERADGGEGATF